MIRSVWAHVVLLVSTVTLAIPAVVWSLLRPGSDITMRLGGVWSRVILSAAGVRPAYEGIDHLRRFTPCVILSNHQSLLDICALTPVLPHPARFVAKQSLFRLPFLGWALSASGFIPIDRSNRERAFRSLSDAARVVRSGRPVVLFPEGTRSRDGRLGPFKRGAFHLALEARVPVVPVAISGTGRSLPPGSLRVTPGAVRVRFAPAIPLEGRDLTIETLIGEVRRAMIERLESPEES